MTWQVAGLGRTVHEDQLSTGLPEDLYREFHQLSEWAQGLAVKFGPHVSVQLVDAASIEGFFKSLVRRFHRYPAFTVGKRHYVGSDFSQVDGLIAAGLGSGTPGREPGSRLPAKGA